MTNTHDDDLKPWISIIQLVIDIILEAIGAQKHVDIVNHRDVEKKCITTIGVSYLDTFLSALTSRTVWNIDQQFQIVPVVIFEAHVHIPFIINAKSLVILVSID